MNADPRDRVGDLRGLGGGNGIREGDGESTDLATEARDEEEAAEAGNGYGVAWR
jgi:hypothetical protein